MHIPKGYIYFAMGFSVGVEMLNIRMRERAGLRPCNCIGQGRRRRKKTVSRENPCWLVEPL